ncbi:hypothetical protein I549_2156 [Mycobacterium avium subsp. avium 2285 (R)]|nr:hypothetical protein I549_2156 [Mycobacterium avium subsp. avium 2285 (R)]
MMAVPMPPPAITSSTASRIQASMGNSDRQGPLRSPAIVNRLSVIENCLLPNWPACSRGCCLMLKRPPSG